jgi:hypothetical protein
MRAIGIEASWTFVQSPTYTAISITVGLIAGIILAALMIQQELLQESGAPDHLPRRARRMARGAPVLCVDDSPRRPRGRVAAVPLIICFAVIVILRLATLAYQRPGTTLTNTTSPTAQQTTAVNMPATP